MEIRKIKFDTDNLSNLLEASEAEGYLQVRRLIEDWKVGTNRFDDLGECFYIALYDKKAVAVCGLNDDGKGRGRLRRLYVHPEYRGRGIGRTLSQKCIDDGLQFFENIVVNAGGEIAKLFYEKWGWQPIEDDRLTHVFCKLDD